MMDWSLKIIAFLFLTGAAGWLFAQNPDAMATEPNQPAALQTQETVEPHPGQAEGYDRYRLVYQQNMFARNRRAVRQQFEKSPEMVRKQVVLSLYVLRGVAVQGDRRAAFIEDVVSGRTLKGQAGTELLGGRITEVKIDAVVFRINNEDKEIAIGGEFGKTESETQVPVELAEVGTAAAEPKPPADTGTDTLNEDELLKQMMERRSRELGK